VKLRPLISVLAGAGAASGDCGRPGKLHPGKNADETLGMFVGTCRSLWKGLLGRVEVCGKVCWDL
jgi:hypothetical protein